MIDDSGLTEEEYKEKKKASIEARNKKKFSNRFILLSNLFLIVETLLIIFILMIPVMIIFGNVVVGSTGIALLFEVCKMVAFLGGLFLGFFIFRKLMNHIIRKKHLEDKLSDDIKNHYLIKTKKEKEMELKR